jgi:N-acetylneuraminic acid mutarotase
LSRKLLRRYKSSVPFAEQKCSPRRAKYEFELEQIDAYMKNRALALAFISAILFSLTVAVTSASGAENSWATKASMHISRTGAGAAAVNGIVYVIGGSQRYNVTDTGFSYMSINATEAYNPATDTWSQKASMPTSRDGLGVAVFQGKLYCFGGRNVSKDYSISTNVNEVYDTETDSWETKTPMPTARSGLQANEVDEKIYLIGGRIETESSSIAETSAQVEIYDPVTDTWAIGSPIPTAVAGYASAVLDGKIYVISGVARGSTRTNLTQIYDPKTDEWSFGAPIPMSVTATAAGATTGTKAAKAIYVIGGSNATYPLSGQYTNQVYFPETNSWSMAASMPVDRAGLSVTVVNDTLYAIGGGHNIFTQDSAVVMHYTPFTSSIAGIEPFPIVPVVIAVLAVVAVVVVGAGLLYRKKHKPRQQTTK